MESTTQSIIVYAESTPNPLTIKFVASVPLLEEGRVLEYDSDAMAKDSPFATNLFGFPFVKSVFISANFVSVTRNTQVEWDDIVLELREFIQDYLLRGGVVVKPGKGEETVLPPDSLHTPYSEMEKKICEILDEYVRPAVESDGGAIHFRSFSGGVLTVTLRGACSGCPSSSMTLKSGIEELFRSMLPEVKEVVACN